MDVGNNGDAVIVSFIAGDVSYDQFILVNDADLVEDAGTSYAWAESDIGPTDPGSTTNAITDNRLDSVVWNPVDLSQGAKFFFERSPASLDDLVFYFELVANDTTVQLLDAAGDSMGSPVGVQFGAILGRTQNQNGTSGMDGASYAGIAIPLRAFGIGEGDRKSVAGVTIDENAGECDRTCRPYRLRRAGHDFSLPLMAGRGRGSSGIR